MQLYQEKHQLKYLSENDVIFLSNQFKEEIAKEMLLDNEPIEKIMRYTKLTEKQILSIKKRLKI